MRTRRGEDERKDRCGERGGKTARRRRGEEEGTGGEVIPARAGQGVGGREAGSPQVGTGAGGEGRRSRRRRRETSEKATFNFNDTPGSTP